MEVIEKSAVYYTGIHKLPLNIFIDAMVDKDYSGLIISGKPTEEEIYIAWENLKDQYDTAMGGQEKLFLLESYISINVLSAKITLIDRLIEVLKICYVRKFADRLNKLTGNKCLFDVTKPEAYDRDLTKCISKGSHLRLVFQMKLEELDRIEKGKGENTEPTRGYYDKILIALSDHAKHEIADTIPVSKFCERVKRLNSYYETLKLREAEKWQQ